MIRCAAFATAIVMAVLSGAADAGERYVDPVSRISFEPPVGSEETDVGCGGEIATFRTRDGADIRVIWRPGSSRSAAGKQEDRTGTAQFLQPVDGGTVEVRCRHLRGKFLDVFFECRRLAQGVRREPAGLERKGIASAKREQEGARRRDPLFSRLALARLHLERGEPEKAEKVLPSDVGTSRLILALKMWAARLKGDIGVVRELAEEFGDEFCGESGALAAHELGRAIRDEEPERALSLFEKSIAADPSLVPAYVSLGRLLLDLGEGTEEVKGRLTTLLSRAPATEEMRRLRRDLDSLQ